MALRAAAKLAALGGAVSAAGVGAYAQYDEGTRAFASALVLPPPLPRSPTTTPRAPVPTRPPPPTADRSPSPEPDLEPNAGTARSVTFWYHCLPVYAQYRAVQFRNRDARRLGVPAWTGVPLDDHDADAAYNALHDAHAGNVRDLVLRMRGFYFKNAQLLSTRDDFVPPQYLEWCKTTQDAAPRGDGARGGETHRRRAVGGARPPRRDRVVGRDPRGGGEHRYRARARG